MKLDIRLLFLPLLGLLLQGCTSVPEGVKPVSPFDLQRYLGTWYEVARFDHRFERGLSHVTATYTVRDDGGVNVVNRGFSAEKDEWDEAQGKAYFVDDANTGHLKVSFFGPFYASYVIMKLDQQDYQYALVTGPDRDYLWILARSPAISEATISELVAYAQQKGYNTDQLIWVEHEQSR
ncbi:lipocalin family protein [Alteromonas oceanisediminis]|uniref:lipocalin family protein n=1 Tax=Alteromonas oceanisediminis TaxID=2836180 RepID=UPI001BDB5923|nr:lipocalin family protein [Alteromonas oceanisediminis]